MPREKDTFWGHVTILNPNNRKWRCNFCGLENAGGATRIKAHLAGISGFGITECEKVNVYVRAEAKVALVGKRGMDSSDQGVSEERIQGNVGAALTSTSNPPNVEGGTNLQIGQGVPPLIPQTRGWMEQMVQEVRAVDIAKIPLDGATRAVLMPEKVMDLSDQGVCEERIQGNVRAAPTSTSHLPNVDGGTNLQIRQGVPPLIPQTHGRMEQMVQEVRVVDIAKIPLNGATRAVLMPEKVRDLRDRGVCEERIQRNVRAAPTSTSHPPNVEGGTNLQFPQGMTEGAPAGASPSQYDQTTVLHFKKPLPSCNEECGTETNSFPWQESMDIYPLSATRVDLQVLEGGANMASSSSQVQPAFVSPQNQSVPQQSINQETKNVQQNPAAPSSTCLPTALMDMDQCISSSLAQAPNNDPPAPLILPCGTGQIGPSSLSGLDMNEDAPMTSHPNTSNNFEENRALKRQLKRLCDREADIRDELEFAACLSLKKLRMEVANWLADVEKLRKSIEVAIEHCLPPHQHVDILMQKAEDLIRRGKFAEGLLEVSQTKVSKLLERKLVGKVFQRNATKILEYLVGNKVSRLGIYGMGGVGKTTLMIHIHNRLLEKADYGHVLWITISQDFNIQRLQDDIGKELGLTTLPEKDVRKRAALLSNCFIQRGKSIIILDDVWEHLDLEEVGIPVRADVIKLVLTTRSFDVCCRMFCQEKIKIEPLSQKEAKRLFLEELGSEVALDLETKAIVKSIVKECAGLPLGIITMARSMRGVNDLFEWKDSLVKLKESDMGQTDMEKVLMNLEFSYNRLGKYEVQQCFLSCALYPEDKLIEKFELIEFFIDQGLIDGLNTREKQYDRGLTILNKLENVCLLENHGRMMKMHDLIRDMALHIMSATSIVKAGMGLMRIPPEEYWMEALEKVSLMENDIREFPLSMSPNCPKLSTLLLNKTLSVDVVIPDSFFDQLLGLKVLNLSGCKLKELPNSISNLVNLKALLLRDCGELHCIPYLGKLRSLIKLEICHCVRLAVLKGLEMLVNLRYLDLIDTCIKKIPKGTLGGLLNLQYLRVWEVNEEEIIKLWALETLECYFEDVDDFNKFVRVIKQSNRRYYRLNVNQEESKFYVKVDYDAQFGNSQRIVHICKCSHAIMSEGGECTGICILIPQDVQTLTGKECSGTTNLSGIGLLENLEELNIERWEDLGVLCGEQDEVINTRKSPALTPNPLILPSLRDLIISHCPKLKYLFGHGSKFNLPHLRLISIKNCKEMVGIISAATSPSPHMLSAFPSLTKLRVQHCHRMKRVMESKCLPHFPNLRGITVKHCKNMEEIIGGPPPSPVGEISLKSLKVRNCYDMKKLFPQELLIHLQNLRSIYVSCCEGMVEMIKGVGQGQEGSIMTPVNNTPSSFQSSISLPKLKRLKLDNTHQLKSIC